MQKDLRNIFLIVLVSILLFVPFIGSLHLFDWDEINFAEAAREMLVSGNFNRVSINYQPFFEKPPLFIWLQAGSMKIFGVNEFAARFPNAMTGMITLLVLYFTGKKIYSQKMGLLWVLCYTGSFLPHLYFKSGIIDPVFNLFMFLSVINFFYFLKKNNKKPDRKNKNLMAAGLFSGLAMMTKGPVGILLPVLTATIYFLLNFKCIKLLLKDIIILLISIIIIPTLYFIIDTLLHGPDFFQQFLQRNIELFSRADAGFSGPFYYHWIVVLLGVFPASFIALAAFKSKNANKYGKDFSLVMIILLLVVLIIFSIVKTKIVHYSSLAYFPVTYFAALFLTNECSKPLLNKRVWFLILVSGTAISLILIFFPLLLRFPLFWIDHLHDPFARAAILDNERWPLKTLLPGIVYLTLLIVLVSMKNIKYNMRLIIFISATVIIIQLCVYLWIPKIEKITQSTMIEFAEKLASKKAYVIPGFKSYAPYFYGKVKPGYSYKPSEIDMILKGFTNKPVYVITKVKNVKKYTDLYGMKVIEYKKGYFLLENFVP